MVEVKLRNQGPRFGVRSRLFQVDRPNPRRAKTKARHLKEAPPNGGKGIRAGAPTKFASTVFFQGINPTHVQSASVTQQMPLAGEASSRNGHTGTPSLLGSRRMSKIGVDAHSRIVVANYRHRVSNDAFRRPRRDPAWFSRTVSWRRVEAAEPDPSLCRGLPPCRARPGLQDSIAGLAGQGHWALSRAGLGGAEGPKPPAPGGWGRRRVRALENADPARDF